MTYTYTNIFGHYGTLSEHRDQARRGAFLPAFGDRTATPQDSATYGTTYSYPARAQQPPMSFGGAGLGQTRSGGDYSSLTAEKQSLIAPVDVTSPGCLSRCLPSSKPRSANLLVASEKQQFGARSKEVNAEFDFPTDAQWYEAYVRTVSTGYNGDTAKDWVTPAFMQMYDCGLGAANSLVIPKKELNFAEPDTELMQRRPRTFAVCHVPVPFKYSREKDKNIVITMIDLQSVGTGFDGYKYTPGYSTYSVPRLVGFTSVCIYIPSVPPPLVGTYMVLIPIVPFGNESSLVSSRRVIKLYDKPQYVIIDSPTLSPYMLAYYTDRLEDT